LFDRVGWTDASQFTSECFIVFWLVELLICRPDYLLTSLVQAGQDRTGVTAAYMISYYPYHFSFDIFYLEQQKTT
jgi:hypothetical protein